MDSPAQVLKRYGLRPKKSWGQCFLHDMNVVERIVKHARVSSSDTVVEIGAGVGTLTRALAASAGLVVAIERDRDLAAVLRSELAHNERITVVEENALTFDFSALGTRVLVVGNLPYNISTPLLFHLLSGHRAITTATVMLQKEVADRVVARPGGRDYGIPSVLVQQLADVCYCFSVSRGAFVPAPRVDSAVVHLVMRDAPRSDCDPSLLHDVVRAAFSSRRKMLKNALASRFTQEAVCLALRESGIDGKRRGETLSIEEFGQLTRGFSAAEARTTPWQGT